MASGIQLDYFTGNGFLFSGAITHQTECFSEFTEPFLIVFPESQTEVCYKKE